MNTLLEYQLLATKRTFPVRVTTFLLEIEDLEFKELSKIGITLMPWHVNIAKHGDPTRPGPGSGESQSKVSAAARDLRAPPRA